MDDYADIINMERPLSSHPKMDLGNRAKLFSSFDALRGFDLALLAKQAERQLTVRRDLLDDAQDETGLASCTCCTAGMKVSDHLLPHGENDRRYGGRDLYHGNRGGGRS